MKIKLHDNEDTDSYDKKNPKVDSSHTCLVVISLDFAFKKDENYYLQVFFFLNVNKKVIRRINDNLSNLSSSDESVDSDEE